MPMPVEYVVEMFCDRVAACKTYHKDNYKDRDALDYFMLGKGRYVMHEDAEKLLEKLLKMLTVKGEDYTFSYIRHLLKKHKKSCGK